MYVHSSFGTLRHFWGMEKFSRRMTAKENDRNEFLSHQNNSIRDFWATKTVTFKSGRTLLHYLQHAIRFSKECDRLKRVCLHQGSTFTNSASQHEYTLRADFQKSCTPVCWWCWQQHITACNAVFHVGLAAIMLHGLWSGRLELGFWVGRDQGIIARTSPPSPLFFGFPAQTPTPEENEDRPAAIN